MYVYSLEELIARMAAHLAGELEDLSESFLAQYCEKVGQLPAKFTPVRTCNAGMVPLRYFAAN